MLLPSHLRLIQFPAEKLNITLISFDACPVCECTEIFERALSAENSVPSKETNMKNITKKLILATLALVALTTVSSKKVYADCESNYGGGETCTYEKNFDIEKKVRIAGDSDWEDKVTGVKKGERVEFRIRVKNTGEVSTSDMEMKDSLPDELNKTGGSGLTENWDDFGEGTTKEFIIQVKVDDSEFDRTGDFEKCVVNEAKVYQDGDSQGSDTATVCYGSGQITELPKTAVGSTTALAVFGIALIGLGLFLKKVSSLA